MKINLFSIPIFIGNIDASKIILENEVFQKTWLSQTTSSHDFSNQLKIDEKSNKYLLDTIAELFKTEMKFSFELELKSIWSNKYDKNDYQEEHLHSSSKFSFIIYKNVTESRTVLISNWKEIIEAYEMANLFDVQFNVKCRSNQICVFPSFMRHMVLKNNFPGETIAGNINFRINNN